MLEQTCNYIKKLEKLNKYEHKAHITTLFFVVVSVLSDWLGSQLHIDLAPKVKDLMHWLHYFSIGLVFVYAVIRFLFLTKPSHVIAKLLPKPNKTNSNSDPKPYIYRGRPIPLEDRIFVTEPTGPLASVLFEMNEAGYEGSVCKTGIMDHIDNTTLAEWNRFDLLYPAISFVLSFIIHHHSDLKSSGKLQ